MTEQELKNELTVLQQKRINLAAQLDHMTLQQQRWDEHISLIQEILVTLQRRSEQEEKLIQIKEVESLGA